MTEHKQEVPRWVRIFTSHKKMTISAKAEARPAKVVAIEAVAAGVVGTVAPVVTVPVGAADAVGSERSEER